MANILSAERRELILNCLIEGMSVRATARIAKSTKPTVLKLLVDAGRVCGAYQDSRFRNLPCRRIEVDELWSFVYCKEGTVPRAKSAPPEAGDVWTWTTICADTKLMPSWRIGDRSSATAVDLLDDLASRVEHRIQLTSDGHSAYTEAVEVAFGGDVDYAQVIKKYGSEPGVTAEKRYSPATCTGIEKKVIVGHPNPETISTSYAERSNLTMRMSMRRFTRLTNAFSKKMENHAAMVALHMYAYNFIKPHRTLSKKGGPPTTPAMAAGITDWRKTTRDIVKMLDADYEVRRTKTRGPYRPRNSN